MHGRIVVFLATWTPGRGPPAAMDREGGAMTPQLCVGGDTTDQEYRGLMRVAGMIARHPDYPGKRDVVEECAEDIVERSHRGRLTPFQRDELLAILSADRVRVA